MMAVGMASLGAADGTGRAVEIIAHRGECGLAPENTLAAFNLAWQRGADAVELDVHLTVDGHLIVCHDADTQRTTGRKLLIPKSTLAELRALDAGRGKGSRWSGQKLPLLEEVLATIPDHRRLFVEVKSGPETVPALKKAVTASGKRPEQVVFISFHAPVIAAVKKTMPEHRAYLLRDFHEDKHTGRWSPTLPEMIAAARAVEADGVAVMAKPPLDAPFIEGLRKAGLEVYAWTVDSPEQARKLVKDGVLGIITNRASWLREQLQGGQGKASAVPRQ
jgi:glycerophosphoryl diester phosphodiesterase